jgi:hypothetical protein
MKQISTALQMYVQDYDEMFPRTMETVSTGTPQTISWWAVHNYQEALNPYIKMGRGTANRASVWWDPSDPDRSSPYMWGSFTANGFVTAIPQTLAAVGSPASTIFATLRQRDWDKVVGVKLPATPPPASDGFWVSEYFDMCLDPWADTGSSSHPYHYSKGLCVPPCSLFPNDANCGDWDKQIDTARYNGSVLISYLDGHVKAGRLSQTYRSPADNDWDLK